MVPYLHGVTEFMRRCATDACADEGSSEAVLKGLVGLMGDMGSTFGARMQASFADATMVAVVERATQLDDFHDVAAYTKEVSATVGPATIAHMMTLICCA
jgi:hypothetical protein